MASQTTKSVKRLRYNYMLALKRLYLCSVACCWAKVHTICVEQVLAESVITEETVLDWLCWHLDAQDLPRAFASGLEGATRTEAITVVAAADPAAVASRSASSLPSCLALLLFYKML